MIFFKNDKICKYIDSSSQICIRYAQSMPEICLNMHIQGMQLHAINMQFYESICKKIANIQTLLVKYAKDMTKYARIMIKYAGNMQIYAKNMQVYTKNLQEICQKHANIQTVLVEYAKKLQ